MPRGFRILHTADSHLGAQLPARRSAHPARGDDFIASYRRVLARAFEFDVDLVVHAGDVFDEPQPSLAAIAAAGEQLLELAAAGIPVVVIPGNHERSALPGSLLFSHPNMHVVREPCTMSFALRGMRVAIAGLPCIRRQSAARFPDALAATGWAAAAADVNLLVVHQTFESAVCGSANFRFRSGEDVLERSSVPREFHYVAAGHVHRHQSLARDGLGTESKRLRRRNVNDGREASRDSSCVATPAAAVQLHSTEKGSAAGNGHQAACIVYAGSPDRITFAEKDEPKGCVLIECNGAALSHRFLEHDVRPMALLPLDVSGMNAERVRAEALQWLGTLPTGSLAQVRLSGQALPRELRGLAMTRYARATRPDVLFSVSAQAVRFVTEREALRGGSIGVPPVECRVRNGQRPMLPIPPAGRETGEPVMQQMDDVAEIVICDAAETKRLPATFGTYALYAGDGRLLYVGKARNLRTRVRTHLGGGDAAAFFAGWTRQIARIEARVAYSEIEALLVEADLIRRHRPPFNRQMRQWERYCYLCEGVLPYGQLQVCADVSEEGTYYGPYRGRLATEEIAEACAVCFGLAACPGENGVDRRRSSWRTRGRAVHRAGRIPVLSPGIDGAARLCERYFANIRSGPCAERIARDEYDERARRCAVLLRGENESMVLAFEEHAEHSGEAGDEAAAALERTAQTLRHVFETGKLLREAEKLIGTNVELPTGGTVRTFAEVRADGIALRRAASEQLGGNLALPIAAAPARLAKGVVDAACTLVRHVRSAQAAAGSGSAT